MSYDLGVLNLSQKKKKKSRTWLYAVVVVVVIVVVSVAAYVLLWVELTSRPTVPAR